MYSWKTPWIIGAFNFLCIYSCSLNDLSWGFISLIRMRCVWNSQATCLLAASPDSSKVIRGNPAFRTLSHTVGSNCWRSQWEGGCWGQWSVEFPILLFSIQFRLRARLQIQQWWLVHHFGLDWYISTALGWVLSYPVQKSIVNDFCDSLTFYIEPPRQTFHLASEVSQHVQNGQVRVFFKT